MLLKKLGLMSLMAIGLSSCTSDIVITPYLVSLKNNQAAEYAVSNPKPIQFKFVRWHPISDIDGYYCAPPEQVAEWLRQYRVYQSDN